MPEPLNNPTIPSGKAADIRSALDADDNKAPLEDGADKVRLKTKVEVPDETNEDETEDDDPSIPEETRAEKRAKREEEELKAKLGADETEEDEETEKPENIQDLDFIAPVRRQEILKKYPNLFKDFPYLAKAYYRDQQLTEYFPTVDDAKYAVETLQQFDNFRQDLLQGNMKSVLKTVKDADKGAFDRIVDNVMQAIGDEDPQAYYHILGNQTKATVGAMLARAQQTNNPDLKTAAEMVYNFVFGQANYQPPTPYAQNQPQQQQQPDIVQQERMQFYGERLNSYRQDIDNKASNQLRAMIEENIDPQKVMTDYVRTKAVEDCYREVEQSIMQDSQLSGRLRGLWERAVKSGFTPDSLKAIQGAVVSRGRNITPTILVKTRNAALQGLGPTQKRPQDKSPVSAGRSTSSSNRGNSKPSPKPSAMSTREYFDLDD